MKRHLSLGLAVVFWIALWPAPQPRSRIRADGAGRSRRSSASTKRSASARSRPAYSRWYSGESNQVANQGAAFMSPR